MHYSYYVLIIMSTHNCNASIPGKFTYPINLFNIVREIVGTLRGFDEFVNMVLDDATEIQDTSDGRKIRVRIDSMRCDKMRSRVILINGRNLLIYL